MKRLKDFMKMCGPWELTRVIIWDPESVEDNYPLFEGWLNDIPYWLAIRKFIKFNEDTDDSGISFRDDLGNGRPGLVIMLESQEKKKKGKKKK